MRRDALLCEEPRPGLFGWWMLETAYRLVALVELGGTWVARPLVELVETPLDSQESGCGFVAFDV